MFVILFYDVNQKRVGKVLKVCRKYLVWEQNSVFEGEITGARLEKLKMELKKLIKKEKGDSVVIYTFRTMKYSKRIILGEDKKDDSEFI